MPERHALSHGWVMAHQRHTQSPARRIRGNGGVFARGRAYGLALVLVAAGILGLELAPAAGWALILVGGWSATLASERAHAR
jgi:hypothetical protein